MIFFNCLGCFQGTFPKKLPLCQDASQMTTHAFRDGFGTYKYIFFSLQSHHVSQFLSQISKRPSLSCVFPREDDDINDVASMAGVNLGEENAQILTSMVGSVVQSCHDQLFLSPNLLLSRILHTGTNAISGKLHISTQTLCCGSSGVLLFHDLIRVQLMWAVPLIGLELDGHVAL